MQGIGLNSGDGGNITIEGGHNTAYGSTNSSGGNVQLSAGNGTGGYSGGNIVLLPGAPNGFVGLGKTNPATTLDVAGSVTANNFIGSGGGLTNINIAAVASAIASGIVITNAFITNSVFAGNGGGLTNLHAAIADVASNVVSGIVINGVTISNSVLTSIAVNGTHISDQTWAMLLNFQALTSLDSLAYGMGNTASGTNATAVGGISNNASGNNSIVVGGKNSLASGESSSAFGFGNTASGNYSIVNGGTNNIAAGSASTAAGGANNIAVGDYSFAAGKNAYAGYNGSYVWGDSSVFSTSDFSTNQFVVRASGGFYFYTGSGTLAGAELASGSGSWSMVSDRNAKENFQSVDAQKILSAVTAMPMTTWNYKTQARTIRHVGPMAQDFHAAIQVGENDTTISTVDEGGVALAAIQGLNEKVEVRRQESEVSLRNLKAENTELKHQNEALEKRLDNLEQTVKSLVGKN